MNRIVITGAGGYIGRQLLAKLQPTPIPLVVFTTKTDQFSENTSISPVHFQLGHAIPEGAIQSNDVVIHLASACMGTGTDTTTEQLDVEGTRLLIEAARAARVKRFIFVSSQSACDDAVTPYARSKWRIEQLLTESNEYIVRPGLVYGKQETGLYGLLCRLIKITRIIPDFCLNNTIQPIHIDELCDALIALIKQDIPSQSVFNLGLSQKLTFKEFLKSMARYKHNKKLFFIPVPIFVVKLGCFLTQMLPFLPTISIERVQGLVNLKSMQVEESLTSLGMEVRMPEYHLRLEAKMGDALEKEADALFTYLGYASPPPELLNQYVLALNCLNNEDSFQPCLPKLLIKFPKLICFYEPPGDQILRQRLNLVSGLLESREDTVAKFWCVKPQSKLFACYRIFCVLFSEALLFPFRLLFSLLSNKSLGSTFTSPSSEQSTTASSSSGERSETRGSRG